MPQRCFVDELAAMVGDGDSLVGGGLPLWRKPLALLRAVARSGVRGLTYSAFLASLDAEILVTAGCVDALEYGYVGRDVLGSSRVLARRDDVERRTRTEFEYWTALRSGARYGVCVLHASLVDGEGNVYAEPLDLMEEDDRMLAEASQRVLVTVEREVAVAPPGASLLLPASVVTAYAVAPQGAAPLGMAGAYPPDLGALLS